MWLRRISGLVAAGCWWFLVPSAVWSQSTSGSGIDLNAIDKSVDPCQDFYHYACGNWLKSNPVPPEYSSWGRFNELQDRNDEILRTVLEDSAAHESRSVLDQKIGGFYQSCINEEAVDKAGYQPIEPTLKRIAGLQSKSDLPVEVARLRAEGISTLFGFYVAPDVDQSTVYLADVDQGGLGLPDRSYYLGDKDTALRTKYLAHISKMMQLTGRTPAEADAEAKAVLKVETSLAQNSLERVARRDPNATHHKTDLATFEATLPDFSFQRYLQTLQIPGFSKLNVSVPAYFTALNELIKTTELQDLKSYLTWHVVSAKASLLSKSFVEEDFDFRDRTLTGAKELQPRWKRCVRLVDRNLGDALGQKFVERAFAGNSKEKTQQLVGEIEKQMAVDIDSLTWMSDETKKQALAKLRGVMNKIGYPERWRDYSSVAISSDNLVSNDEQASRFEAHRRLSRVGQMVDRKEFNMTAPTVNAYYNPAENNINFPAGILQPPFYRKEADLAVNLGGIGVVIGHELTHGFDDQGRQFDADGDLRDWWKPQDASEFKQRADCLVNEYSQFSPVEGVHLNGRLTLGENGADNAGIRLAYMALVSDLAKGSVDKGKLDGFTPEQRFFLGFAQVWCVNFRPEALRLRARTDPHSPGEYRVIGTVQNQPEFGKAFGCGADQPMTPPKGCRVW